MKTKQMFFYLIGYSALIAFVIVSNRNYLFDMEIYKNFDNPKVPHLAGVYFLLGYLISFLIYYIKKGVEIFRKNTENKDFLDEIKSRWEFTITWHLNKVYNLTISSKYTFPFCSVKIWRFDLNTPDEDLNKIRKYYNFFSLVKFYNYCVFIIVMVAFFCWFVKKIQIEPAPAEKIAIGYFVTFCIVSITLLIFYLIKIKEEKLGKDWKVVIKEKFAL